MLACAQITIRDENDIHIGAQPPPNPAIDQLWLNSSVVPNTLHRWNGETWELVGQDIDLDDFYTKAETNTMFTQTSAEIALKANSSTVTALATRVSDAELKITPTAIVNTVRTSNLYQYDLYDGRNYALLSHAEIKFVDNYVQNASGNPTSYTSSSLQVSEDLFAHSGSGANIRMSFDIKRTNVGSTNANAYYSGVWVYYRYLGTDGITVQTTGRGWYMRTTDADFVSTDSDWVRMTKGPLNLTTYAPISIAYFAYGTSSASGTTGAIQFRNAKLEVGNSYTSWSAAPEDLGALPGRVSTAESNIIQNANNIALKVSQSIYDNEKVYRSATAPANPTTGMLWLNTGTSPYLLSRWNGSAWVAAGTDKLIASGINITPNEIVMRTTNFILQLLDPANPENVLMDMRADGRVGFRQLFADEVVSNSVVAAYTGNTSLYVNPSYTGTASNYFKSLREACESLNGKYLRDTVYIYFANSTTETVYENAGITLKGVCGPGRVWITASGRNKSIVGYIFIDSCTVGVFLDYLNIRESRPLDGSNRNKAVVYAHHSAHVTVQHCTLNGNSKTDSGFHAEYTNSAMWDCALQNVNTGYYVNSDMGVMEACTGALTNAMWSNAGIVFCVGTVPTGARTKTKNGVIYETGSTSGGGSTPPSTITPEYTATFSSTTKTYRSGAWRTDTTDMAQGAYNDAGYSSSVGWNYGCCWFTNITSTLSGKTVRSASLTITRNTGSGPSGSVYMYLYAISNTTSSGAPNQTLTIGNVGAIGRGETVTINLPLSVAQGLASGTYGGLCLYETPYNFGKSAYSSNYSRYGAPSLYVVYT